MVFYLLNSPGKGKIKPTFSLLRYGEKNNILSPMIKQKVLGKISGNGIIFAYSSFNHR